MNRLVTFTMAVILVALIGWLMIAGRGLLMPFVIALFIWHLLNTINNSIELIPYTDRLPSWLRMVISLTLVAVAIRILVSIITNNVNEVIAASPRYQENLLHIYNQLNDKWHLNNVVDFDAFIKELNVQSMVLSIYNVFTTLMSSAVLITLYVAFMFVEQHYFAAKLQALFRQSEHKKLVNNIISHIMKNTQTYLGLKTFLSLITAVASWLIMKAVGLDFADFWALLIFFLNFIPNIGAMVATAFPAALALIQFQGWLPFIEISSGIVAVQFIVGNLLEPKMMGKSLNLSPLVIMLALSFWGAIWGILGMFLSVPVTVMVMIIFAHFESTRPVAIMLSQDGEVRKLYEKMDV